MRSLPIVFTHDVSNEYILPRKKNILYANLEHGAIFPYRLHALVVLIVNAKRFMPVVV